MNGESESSCESKIGHFSSLTGAEAVHCNKGQRMQRQHSNVSNDSKYSESESSCNSTISESTSLSGAAKIIGHGSKKQKTKRKHSNVLASRKINLSDNEALENLTKNSTNNTENSYSTTENGMPRDLKFDAFLPPSQSKPANFPHIDMPECSNSDSSVPNSQNSPVKCCSFQTNEEDNVVLQQTHDIVGDKHIHISNNEIDFGNETTCREELHQHKSSQENMKKFHKSIKFQIYHCCVCHEAWPLKPRPKNTVSYTCSRCLRDKNVPKKFSIENSMIPSPVPKELQDLTQFEEMLIAKAFPVMHIYTKPRGGQRACYYLATGCTTACRYTTQVP